MNLEGPGDDYVRRLAREKDFSGDLLPKLEHAGRIFRERRASSVTTQFVVGAAGERDREILAVVARLEREALLQHAHFSAFQPVVGTPMEGLAPTPARRELRLYQAEHLLRDYGFRFDELAFEGDGNLSLDHDPKAARRLVAARRQATLRFAGDLRGVGVDVARAGWYLAAGTASRRGATRVPAPALCPRPAPDAGAVRDAGPALGLPLSAEHLAQTRGRTRGGIGANATLLLPDRVEDALDRVPHDVRLEVDRRLAHEPAEL